MKIPKESEGLRGLLKGLDVDLDECEAILNRAKRSRVRILER